MQQEAGNKLRFSAGRTMSVAQGLYERGYITYMRTDSIKLSEQAVDAARAQIVERFGQAYLPPAPRTYANKMKNAQEAHEAIRPSGARFRTPEDVRGELSRDEQPLYELIWMRTVASQMTDARGRSLTLAPRGHVERRRGGDLPRVGPHLRVPRLPHGVRRRERRARRPTTTRRTSRRSVRAKASRAKGSRRTATPPSRRRATPRPPW